MISANVDKKTRKAVYARDGYRCALCDDTRTLQIHHVIHRSQGGSNHEHNLITLCSNCHALAHGTNLTEWTDITPESIQQAIVEYLADYYAPDWNPWRKGEHPTEKEAKPSLDLTSPEKWCPICDNGQNGTKKCPGGSEFCPEWKPMKKEAN